MIRILYAHLPWFLLALLISIQSSMSNIYLPDIGIDFTDKMLHFGVFGIWGMLLTRGLLMTKSDFVHRYLMWIVFVAGMIFAFSDEWHQYYVPGRTSDVYDWIADISGILIFSALYKLFVRLKDQVESE